MAIHQPRFGFNCGMVKRRNQPAALTIAGSDSGGEAGIQADLKTFAALGVHGASVITCLTAQNARGIRAVQPASPAMLRQQIAAVCDALPLRAVKTGMLFSAANVRAVSAELGRRKPTFLIVDPVLVSTRGVKLLRGDGLAALQRELLPLASLVTPNVREAEVLTGRELTSVEDLRSAARVIHSRFGCAALVKGGHLPEMREAVDIFWDGREELLLSAPFVPGLKTHGTGCTYAAAITGYLALGCELPYAVEMAKQYITRAIADSVRVGGRTVLNWLWD